MTVKLFFNAILKFIMGIFIVGLLLFLPAGTINYLFGWIFMGLLFIPMFIAGIIMMIKNPALLKKRLNAKEKLGKQALVIKLSGLMFLMGFVIAGLDYRFKWTKMPNFISYIGIVIFILSYIMYGFVLKQNTYLSRTITVEDNQHVVDTGLYSVIRHPMYTATIFLFLSIPLILGSLLSLLIFLHYPIIIIARLKNEEQYLEKSLNGYIEYKNKVKYRLIPYIY